MMKETVWPGVFSEHPGEPGDVRNAPICKQDSKAPVSRSLPQKDKLELLNSLWVYSVVYSAQLPQNMFIHVVIFPSLLSFCLFEVRDWKKVGVSKGGKHDKWRRNGKPFAGLQRALACELTAAMSSQFCHHTMKLPFLISKTRELSQMLSRVSSNTNILIPQRPAGGH